MKKKSLRIAAGITAVLLICGLAVIANAFLGNPVSYLLAKKCVERNLAEHHADQGFVLQSLVYNFKDTAYTAFAEVPNTLDYHFEMSVSMTGKLRYDTYADDVESGKNTFLRLDQEYRDLADTVLDSNALPFRTSTDFGTLKDSGIPAWWRNGALEPDGSYNIQELGAQYGIITISVGEQDVTAERAAEILLQTKEIMMQRGVPFHDISLSLHQPWKDEGVPPEETEGKTFFDLKAIHIQLFPFDEIYEDGLTERIKATAEFQNIT